MNSGRISLGIWRKCRDPASRIYWDQKVTRAEWEFLDTCSARHICIQFDILIRSSSTGTSGLRGTYGVVSLDTVIPFDRTLFDSTRGWRTVVILSSSFVHSMIDHGGTLLSSRS
jgi:hypothetical protein